MSLGLLPSASQVLPKTDAAIGKLALPAGTAEAFIWHPAIKGLGLRLRAGKGGCAKVWTVQYRDTSGATRRVTLGRHPGLSLAAAEKGAKVHLGDLARGVDPAKQRTAARAARASAVPLRQVFDAYLAARDGDLAPASLAQYRRGLLDHLAKLHKVDVGAADAATVSRALDAVQENAGPIARNRAHAALAACARWAAGHGMAPVTLAATVAAIPKKAETPRDRVLSNDELASIWKAAGLGHSFHRITRLLLLTGTRRSEIGGLRWSHQEDDSWFVLPSTATKARVRHPIPILRAIAAELPERGNRDFIFGEGDAPFSGWSSGMRRLEARRAELLGVKVDTLAPWGLHDFRRTLSTRMNEHRLADPLVIEKLLGHVPPKIRTIYNTSGWHQDRRDALAAWHAHLAPIIGIAA